ncbi:hypothetical protein C7S13_7936 [Burkholderia cepacia]|nr:hypothetical protein [Burkholderia cepacia]
MVAACGGAVLKQFAKRSRQGRSGHDVVGRGMKTASRGLAPAGARALPRRTSGYGYSARWNRSIMCVML